MPFSLVGTLTRISRSVTCGCVVKLSFVGLVVLLDLVVADGDLAHDLDLLHAARQHVALDLLAQILERHVFLLERRLELLFGLDLVLFLDVVDDVAELLGAERVAQLAAALDEQQLVNGVDDDVGRDVDERLLQLGVGARPEVRVALPQRGDLPLLELGLGDDVAVHLHQNLFEDVRAGPRRRHTDQQKGDEPGKAFHG